MGCPVLVMLVGLAASSGGFAFDHGAHTRAITITIPLQIGTLLRATFRRGIFVPFGTLQPL
jgi:hypothetical protein